MILLSRQCQCGKEIRYKTASGFKLAEKNNTKCSNCRCAKPDYEKLYNRFKKSAEERGKVFNLTSSYLEGLLDGCSRRCYYTGVILDYAAMSLDRLDSSIGYVKGNVVLCGKKSNQMKYTYQVSEFVDECKKIALHQTHLANVGSTRK